MKNMMCEGLISLPRTQSTDFQWATEYPFWIFPPPSKRRGTGWKCLGMNLNLVSQVSRHLPMPDASTFLKRKELDLKYLLGDRWSFNVRSTNCQM